MSNKGVIMDITESIFGENKEDESPMNALRGFRIGDIVEYKEMLWAFSKINSSCTLRLETSTQCEPAVNPKEITRNISRGD